MLTHQFSDIVKQSRLTQDLFKAKQQNPQFAAGWDLVEKWNVESRYAIWTREDADAMLTAITRRKDGVLPWIKERW